MIKEILVSLISAAIIASAGYLFIIKENQINITNLTREINELKKLKETPIKINFLTTEIKELRELEEKIQSSLNSTKLFIAAAHPSRDLTILVSIAKLQKMKPKEVELIASNIDKWDMDATNTKINNAPNELKLLLDKYKINKEDLTVFATVTNESLVPLNPYELPIHQPIFRLPNDLYNFKMEKYARQLPPFVIEQPYKYNRNDILNRSLKKGS